MATLSQWIAGARPRTLPAAVAPVVVGTAAAAPLDRADLGLGLLAVLVSLGLQVGVNYANDYSDGIRGTDADRVGPIRLVGQHKAKPENVKLMAFAFFGAAALVGLALVAISEAWIMVPLGALAVLAAWKYTGGDNPYGYRGLGELYVFVFFGLMATLGTLYTQAKELTSVGVYGAVGVGAIASAILVANNLRDIPTDRESGKLTLAVRLGDRGTRILYVALVVVAVLMVLAISTQQVFALIALLSLAVIAKPLKALLSGATGRDLVPVLASTGIFEIVYAVLLAAGIAISLAACGPPPGPACHDGPWRQSWAHPRSLVGRTSNGGSTSTCPGSSPRTCGRPSTSSRPPTRRSAGTRVRSSCCAMSGFSGPELRLVAAPWRHVPRCPAPLSAHGPRATCDAGPEAGRRAGSDRVTSAGRSRSSREHGRGRGLRPGLAAS